MPYESPNIVIVPTVSMIVHKKGQSGPKPSTQCYKNKASTATPDIENSAKPLLTQVTKMSSQKPSKSSSDTHSEIINEKSKGVAKTTSQGNTSNPALITDVSVDKNSANMHNSKGIGTQLAQANSSKNQKHNIEQYTKPATTVTDAIEPNVLSTSNDIKQNVNSKGNTKPDQQIITNLSSCSKVMKTNQPILPPENLRPYVDTNTWTCPPVLQTSADQSWILPQYQQDIADPDAGFKPRMDTKAWLTQQYHANHDHSQNENMNSNNVNSAMIQGHSFTHYYTPSYKSPMDYTWLSHEYYTNLSSYYQTNNYRSKLNENIAGEKLNNSIKQTVIKPNLDRKSLSPNDSKIVKPTYKETLSKHEILEKNYKNTSNYLQDLKERRKQTQDFYRKNKIEELPRSKTNTHENQRRKSLDLKIKQSDRDKILSKTIKTCNPSNDRERCKSKEGSKVKEDFNNRKTNEYVGDKNKKHIHEKRKHVRSDQTYKTSAHNEEDSVSKIRKLTHSTATIKKHTPRKSNKELDSRSKDEIKNRSRHVDTHSEPQKKRIHSGSSSEFLPKKRFRSAEKVDHNDTCEKITPVKSVVIFSNNPELRHPRIQAPESVSCQLNSNKDIETHFDLRSKLNRKEKNKMYYKSQDNEMKATGEQNLLVTVNKSKHDSILPKPGPSKLTQKNKKVKKYQLVINVICKNPEDSSDSSSSDENDSKNTIHSPNVVSADEMELKPDLSFLDDINIDEIVSSLNHNEVLSITQDTKIPVTDIKKNVQPTFVESEIRSELIQPEIPDKQSNCDNSQYMSYDSDDTVNLGSPNSNMHQQNTGVIEPEINNITNQDSTITVKKEKHVDEPKNIFVCKQDTQISYNELENSASNKNVNEIANNLIDKVIENMQMHTDVSSVEILRNIKSEPCDSYDDNNENEALEPIVTDKEIKLEKFIETVPVSSIDKVRQWCSNMNQDNETQDFVAAEKKNDLEKLNEIVEFAIIDESASFQNPCKLSDKTYYNTESPNVADFIEINKAENNNDTEKTLNVVESGETEDNEIISENKIQIESYAGTETNITVYPLPKSVNVMKKRIEDKSEDDSLVKCDEAEDKNEELSKTNEDANNSNIKIICDTIVQPSHNSAVLKLKMKEKSIEIEPGLTKSANTAIKSIGIEPGLTKSANTAKKSTEIEPGLTKSANTAKKTTEIEPALTKSANTAKKSTEIEPALTKTAYTAKKSTEIEPALTKSANTAKKFTEIEPALTKSANTAKKSTEIEPGLTKSANTAKKSTEIEPALAKSANTAKKSTEIEPALTTSANTAKKSTEIEPGLTKSANTAIRDQKQEIKTDANIHPSLKLHKGLVSKIQERVLEYLKLNVKVLSLVRNGKFSKIFKCEDKDNHYALKFIKHKQGYHSLGVKKEDMLYSLQEDIPKENLNTVYLINGLGVDRNWCFLMDYYPNNLMVVIMQTKFDIATVQDLARQLVSAVMVMRNKNIVHSDIKPLHILLDSTNKRLKVCGFDEAYYAGDKKEVLPNIGTAVYRAPEIILGYSAGFSIDVWATALVIYEMVAGTKLFERFGFNNEMLFNQMVMFGYLPADMVLNSRYGNKHFLGSDFKRIVGSCGQYVLYSMDQFSNRMQMYDVLMPLGNRVCKSSNFRNQLEDLAKLANLARLLDKMLALDPRRRIPIEFVYTDSFFMYRNAEIANFRYF